MDVDVDVDAFLLLILLLRRIPEIQSRQFHLLLSYLSMTPAARSLFNIHTIYIIVICLNEKTSPGFRPFSSEKKGYYQKLYMLPEIIHTHADFVESQLNIWVCSHLKCEAHLISM